jgi:excisionase family DNA binding protein
MIELSSENALNERQAAKFLGVSPGTLRLWRSENRSPRFFRAGKLIRFRIRDLNEWIEQRLSTSTTTETK